MFIHREIGEVKVENLINHSQGSMLVKDYCLKFSQLSKYALELWQDSKGCISKFITEVFDLVVKECRTSILIRDMDIS